MSTPTPDGPTAGVIVLPDGQTHLIEEGWCLGCEALDPKPWRFTESQAEVMRWVICLDCEDRFHLVGSQTDSGATS